MGKKSEVSRSPGGRSIAVPKHQLLNLLRRIFEERVFSALDCL